MGSISVNIAPLQAAVDRLATLADTVESARSVADGAVPPQFSISTLTTGGSAGTFPGWARDQRVSPLSVVLDTAKLLETPGSTGPVQITFPGEYSIDHLTASLGGLLADRLGEAETPEELEEYLAMAATYRDVPAVQDPMLENMGEDGVVDLLTRAGEAGVAMTTVHAAFSADSQSTIAGWVEGDIENPENIDTDTTTLLAGFSASAEFSTALYDNVTPDQMTDAIQHLNANTYTEHTDEHGNVISVTVDEGLHQVYQQFLHGAGTTFATYTHAVDDPGALSETWYDAITDDDKPGNASALTLLLRKGGENAEFDTDFLAPLTDRVFEWEKDQDGAVWGPRDEGDRLLDPDVAVADVEQFNGLDWEAAVRSDGLANLLGAMERSPEAAQEFFAAGYENGQPGGTNERLEYLMLERTFSKADLSDEGYGLGAALEAAAAGDRDDWSAGFATDVFEFAAEHAGTEDDAWILDDEYWGYPGTSVALGNIGAAYADDIYSLLADPDTRPTEDGHLQISAEELEKALGMIGRHDDMSGLESMSAALLSEGNARYREELEGFAGLGQTDLASLRPDQITELLGHSNTSGEVLGQVLTWGLEGKISGEELEEQRAAMAAKAFDIATSFVPGAGDVAAGLKDTLWETAIDTGKDEGLGALKDLIANSPSATSGEYATAQNERFENLIQYNTMDQLLATGFLDAYELDESLYSGTGGERRFIDDVRGTGGVPDFDEEDISADERQRRIDLQNAVNYLISTDPQFDGPGALLDGLISPAYNGYERVAPPSEG